jgi:cytochrome c oxidase subunit 1/cytochrome c oxidase subunit I+III
VIWLMVLGAVCEIVILALWLTPKPHAAEERVEVYE